MSDFSQGPGWWQASDGKWYPPEQAPGYQPPAGAPMPGGGGTDIGTVLSYAWNKFVQNIGEWIILWLILIGVSVLVRIVGAALNFGTGGTSLGFSLGIGTLINLVYFIIEGVLLVALAKGAVMQVNGQRINVGACFQLTGNNLVAGVVFGLILGVLNFFCFFPTVLGFLFLGFVPVLSAMDDKGADAIGESFSLSTSRASESMVFWLIAWFISICLCFLGGPISMIGGAYLLKRFRGEAVAP